MLENTSTARDALQVDLVVNVYARSGRLIAQEGPYPPITVVPAGSRFYYGDATGGTAPVWRVKVTVHVGKTIPERAVLPRFKNLHSEGSQVLRACRNTGERHAQRDLRF